MKQLNKNQWVAVVVSVLIIAAFIYFFTPVSTSMSIQNKNTQNPSEKLTVSANQASAKPAKVAEQGALVSVNYTGKFANGTTFDSSAGRGPIKFVLGTGQVIKGWDEGILGMKVGDKKSLVIPPEKAYGAQGYPPVIPPNSTLYFDVELVDVQNQ